MTMNMKMVTRPGIFLRRQELISQLVWQGTGHHPAVCEKRVSAQIFWEGLLRADLLVDAPKNSVR